MIPNILQTGISNTQLREILVFGQVLINDLPDFEKIIPEVYFLLSKPDIMLACHLYVWTILYHLFY